MNIPEEVKENLPEIVAETQTEEPRPSTPVKYPPLWRNRDYMLLWSGQVVSALGSGMSGLVFPLLILAITDSAMIAGFAGALGSLPYLLFSLPVGALIDRWDRKKVMMICDAFRALNFATIPLALYFDALTEWQLLANSFIEGSLFVFFNIAEVAALSRVVPKGQLPQAAAQNEAGFISAFLAGPPLGGFLYQSVSRMLPFIADAISYGASVISLFFIKTRFQEERPSTAERHLGKEIKEGLSWLWSHPLIRFMAFLTGGLNFVNSGTFLILLFAAKEALGASETEIGWMFSIAAAGGIVGSLVGGQIQKRFSFGQVIITVGWIATLLYPLYAIAPNFYVLGIIAGLSFMTGPIYNVVQFSYRLALIPDALQGRVNSTFRLLAYGFQPLGQAIAGIFLESIGITYTILFFAFWSVFLTILTTFNSHVRNARPITEIAATQSH
jgi:MFS family permease